MVRFAARLIAKLRQRFSAPEGSSATALESRVLKIRRTGSLLLVIAGAGMIAITLASEDGSAMRDEPAPPAAPVVRLGDDSIPPVQNQAPVRVAAPTTQSLANPTGGSVVVSVTRSYPFVWPAAGPITSVMGPWHTLGIDIGLSYDEDSPILASARGVVTSPAVRTMRITVTTS